MKNIHSLFFPQLKNANSHCEAVAHPKKPRNALAFGLAGFAGLLLFFFGVLSFANSPWHAIDQFKADWYWILPLTIGFGTQIGLYVWLQNQLLNVSSAGKEMAATGTVSGASMVACCAHHVTDVLPLLGLAGAAVFLQQYQSVFIIVGLFSNLAGIVLMLKAAQAHNVLQNHFVFSRLKNWNWEKALSLVLFFGFAAVSATAYGVF